MRLSAFPAKYVVLILTNFEAEQDSEFLSAVKHSWKELCGEGKNHSLHHLYGPGKYNKLFFNFINYSHEWKDNSAEDVYEYLELCANISQYSSISQNLERLAHRIHHLLDQIPTGIEPCLEVLWCTAPLRPPSEEDADVFCSSIPFYGALKRLVSFHGCNLNIVVNSSSDSISSMKSWHQCFRSSLWRSSFVDIAKDDDSLQVCDFYFRPSFPDLISFHCSWKGKLFNLVNSPQNELHAILHLSASPASSAKSLPSDTSASLSAAIIIPLELLSSRPPPSDSDFHPSFLKIYQSIPINSLPLDVFTHYQATLHISSPHEKLPFLFSSHRKSTHAFLAKLCCASRSSSQRLMKHWLSEWIDTFEPLSQLTCVSSKDKYASIVEGPTFLFTSLGHDDPTQNACQLQGFLLQDVQTCIFAMDLQETIQRLFDSMQIGYSSYCFRKSCSLSDSCSSSLDPNPNNPQSLCRLLYPKITSFLERDFLTQFLKLGYSEPEKMDCKSSKKRAFAQQFNQLVKRIKPKEIASSLLKPKDSKSFSRQLKSSYQSRELPPKRRSNRHTSSKHRKSSITSETLSVAPFSGSKESTSFFHHGYSQEFKSLLSSELTLWNASDSHKSPHDDPRKIQSTSTAWSLNKDIAFDINYHQSPAKNILKEKNPVTLSEKTPQPQSKKSQKGNTFAKEFSSPATRAKDKAKRALFSQVKQQLMPTHPNLTKEKQAEIYKILFRLLRVQGKEENLYSSTQQEIQNMVSSILPTILDLNSTLTLNK